MTCQKPELEGGPVTQIALSYGQASDTIKEKLWQIHLCTLN